MYSHILLPLDNSDWAPLCVQVAIDIGRKTSCREIVGMHVYAASLHDRAFQRMEAGLPANYQEPAELARQRRIHDGLIRHGLELISHSYLEDFSRRTSEAGVQSSSKVVEGKHFHEIAAEANRNGYDLVVLGARGLGKFEQAPVGSVCERAVRRMRKDVLVVRHVDGMEGGRILAGIDGSDYSFQALKKALFLARAYNSQVEAIYVYDPFFHDVAFSRLAEVLSPEAASVFRFQEQQKLHDEIINMGLSKVGEGYLRQARALAAQHGVDLHTKILSGKIFATFLEHVEQTRPALVVMGRYGLHFTPGAEIGSNAENIYRLAPTNVLICAGGDAGHASSSQDSGVAEAEKASA
ncbi:MAG: universal stress protein [Clostridia bacterium]|nr:MAG: universal stress protein [Clostridia bacterium]